MNMNLQRDRRILEFLTKIVFSLLILLSFHDSLSADEAQIIKVGIATPLSGDGAVIGENLRKTIDTYEKRYLRHPIKFIFEDARRSSLDGLNAYKHLIEVEKVDLVIGGTTSNGTLAAAPLVNQSKTVLLTPLTGGSNIDSAGEYIFRIGNSDILNGTQQVDLLLSKDIKRVALVTEQTAYTSDIAKYFRERFLAEGGKIVVDEEFLPETADFRPLIVKIRNAQPQAVFMSTQTGLAFGLFMKKLSELKLDPKIEVHTNFLSANNPEAREVAGEALDGVFYMAPSYDARNPKLVQFLEEFQSDHGELPTTTFHTAGTVDSLNLLQSYLDQNNTFEGTKFHDFLLRQVKNYSGLMGTYSFNSEGNADIGFSPARIGVEPPA